MPYTKFYEEQGHIIMEEDGVKCVFPGGMPDKFPMAAHDVSRLMEMAYLQGMEDKANEIKVESRNG